MLLKEKKRFDYYAFGMEMPGRSIGSDFAYNFNGKRTDKWNGDNGSYLDFGARILDTRLGRWFSEDPRKGIYVGLSPYNYAGNSPLLFIDVEGEWISRPNKITGQLELVAEAGDNFYTFLIFLGVKDPNGNTNKNTNEEYMDAWALYNTAEKGVISVPNDRYTYIQQALKHSHDILNTAEYSPASNNYNCWTAAICGSNDAPFVFKAKSSGKKGFDFFEIGKEYEDALKYSYSSSTTPDNALFGRTVLKFTNIKGTQHGAIFMGRSSNGEILVFTKDGWQVKPRIVALKFDLVDKKYYLPDNPSFPTYDMKKEYGYIDWFNNGNPKNYNKSSFDMLKKLRQAQQNNSNQNKQGQKKSSVKKGGVPSF